LIALSLHLAPNAPWLPLLLACLGLAALGVWAYRIAVPPLPALARRALPLLRVAALVALVLLLAQPVLERDRGGRATRLAVLVDRSWSMDLPVAGPGSVTRAAAAERAVDELRRALRGRAAVREAAFAARLEPDSARSAAGGATALGSALAALPLSPLGQDLDGVVVVSDGAVNSGEDPVAAARALGVPVHAVLVGGAVGRDRAVVEVEASASARVGEATPVRVRIASGEERGAPIAVTLHEGGRELARATVIAPGAGAEALAELRVVPARPGLAVWTARVDSLPGEPTTANNARQVAVEVTPGRLGVVIVAADLNWDLTFLRRALSGDSSLALDTRVRWAGGWRALESARGAPPLPADLGGRAVVILDGINPAEISPGFDAALAGFVRGGGGLLALGGSAPGLWRFRTGALGAALAMQEGPGRRSASPRPTPEARELMAWDEDPARGERAWRSAAPLAEVAAIRPGAGDRVLLAAADGGPPLMVARRVGRGQALVVNGTGLWRWSLSGLDEFAADRAQRLWRHLVRWLAQPVQGEPLRVRPDRWLSARGEPVRLLASLQDRDFKPVAGATVEGEAQDAAGRRRPVRYVAREAGSYVALLEDLPPGRYRVSARATRGGRELGVAASEFAVDRWSLEEARAEPDSAALAAVAAAAQGRTTSAAQAGRWARTLPARALARTRTESLRLWESPWVFAALVGVLGLEWAWRRRRGLP
jgi:hypothetical protein